MERKHVRRYREVEIPLHPRPPKEFIELLRQGTKFSWRENKRGEKEVQVRIGTSRRNSVAVPVVYLETLHQHISEVLEKKDEMVKQVQHEVQVD